MVFTEFARHISESIIISIAFTVAIFIIDITTPLGYADWLLYFIPLFISSSVLKRRYVPVLPFLATLLVSAGYFFSPPGGDPVRAAINRGVGVLALWWTALIIIKRKQSEEAVRRSNQELERRVHEATAELRQANRSLKEEIANRRKTEEDFRALTRKHELILDFAGDGIFGTDSEGRIMFVNNAAARMLGYTPDELIGKSAHAAVHYAKPDGAPYPVEECSVAWDNRDGNIHSGQEFFWRKDGSCFPVDFKSVPFREDGIRGAVITFRDVTERKKMEDEIRHMAYHDALTGLPNRRLFLQIINIEIAQARRHQTKLAILFLDLDRFKEINDTLGHDVGDQLLQEVAVRLKGALRESDTVARIGGDEFNLILPDVDHPEFASDVARKILDRMQKPFAIAGHEFSTSGSIGISIYPDDSEELDVLFRYADIAMFYAKERGRNGFQFYDPDINVRSIERLRFESYLRQTLERRELVVHYQPQIVSRTRKIVSAEALVRWKHPELGLLEANHFVPAAESIGLITSIDEWVLKTACVQFKALMDEGYDHLSVAVNISSRAFQSRDIIDIIRTTLEETGLPEDRLEIEITESVVMADIERTAASLKELAALGIRIAIDDFGTGYSSLNYLKKLPIQRLKIDQTFVRDIASDADDRSIIKAVTAMAHNMNMKVIAEGVENEEQLSFLSRIQCDEAQGFLVGRSLPAEEFKALIAAQ